MNTRRIMILLIVILLSSTQLLMSGASFATVETKTLDGADFTFPDDALKTQITLFALALGTSRASGEMQQGHLLQWQRLLESDGGSLGKIPIYHFPVLDVPRFIQGVVRRGIAKSYDELVPPDQGAILFLKQADEFASQAGIPIDDQATLAVVRSDRSIVGFVKGPPTTATYTELKSLLATEESKP
ncbi:MAG TPA: hypothetical protein VKZ39_02160 [Sphaerochaetaceae bacterium]|nr:hypothetical protein [Sphaerochaetaceae bacterium]